MFGKNWHGPWDSILAYANYFRRGSQQGEHSEPWYYYLQILFAYRPAKRIFWSEGFIAVLALIGGIDALVRRRQRLRERLPTTQPVSCPSPALLRFLTFYTFLLTLLYSLISYKTPWCALSFLMGMILLAGVGAAAIFRLLPSWPTEVDRRDRAGCRRGASRLAGLSIELQPAITLPTRRIPMSTPTRRCPCRIWPRGSIAWPSGCRKAATCGSRWSVTDNYWPLPWYLRKFNEKRVGYWLDAKGWKQDRDHFPPPAILILSSDIDCDDLATSPGRLRRPRL